MAINMPVIPAPITQTAGFRFMFRSNTLLVAEDSMDFSLNEEC